MAHNGRCKVCGNHIRISDLKSGNGNAVSQAVPFWLWLLPIPIISAIIVKWNGPKFCGEACKLAWKKHHPLWWMWTLIASHIIVPAVIAVICYAAALNENAAPTGTNPTQQSSE